MQQTKPSRDPNVYALVGLRIRESRKARQMSQSLLAEMTNLKRPSIVLIEAGKQRLPIDRLCLIAKVLRVEPGDLMPQLKEISSDVRQNSVFLHGSNNLEEDEMKKIRAELDAMEQSRGNKDS